MRELLASLQNLSRTRFWCSSFTRLLQTRHRSDRRDSPGATRRRRAPGRRKILKVVRRSALRKARSVPSFDPQRNCCCSLHIVALAKTDATPTRHVVVERRRKRSEGRSRRLNGGSYQRQPP